MVSTAIRSDGWVPIQVDGQALEARLLISGVPVRTASVWDRVSGDIETFLEEYQGEVGGLGDRPISFSVLRPQADTASKMDFRISQGGHRPQGVSADTLDSLGADFGEIMLTMRRMAIEAMVAQMGSAAPAQRPGGPSKSMGKGHIGIGKTRKVPASEGRLKKKKPSKTLGTKRSRAWANRKRAH